MSGLTYGAPTTDAQREAYCGALALAFATTRESCAEWLTRAGVEHTRVLTDGAANMLAGLLLVPLGQFFGGRRVAMCGIAGVATPPEFRSQGAALELMRRAVQEARKTGAPISVLYAATQTLYRKAGYEQAGVLYEATVNPALIGVRDKSAGLRVRPAAAADDAAIRSLYARHAADCDGRVDRSEYIWHRIRNPREATAAGFVIEPEGGGAIEGYVYLSQKRNETGRHDTTLTDALGTTARANRRILSFLHDQRSMCASITWRPAPGDPLLLMMPERAGAQRVREAWMLRVCDVPGALAARGYAPGVSGAAAFRVEDETVAENRGEWALRVEGGRGIVERGLGAGAAVVECDVRGLAALYTGFVSAHALRDAGLLRGDDAACDAVSALFAPARSRAGVAPGMADFF